MNAAGILLIIQGIQAALTAAPQIEALAEEARKWLAALFEAGVITAEVQNQLDAHVTEVVKAVLEGNPPPEFTVEPDPS